MSTSVVTIAAGGIVLLVVAVAISVITILRSRLAAKQGECEVLSSRLTEREQRVEGLVEELRQLTSERDVERARAEGVQRQLDSSKEEMQRLFREQVAQIKESYEREHQQIKLNAEQLMTQLRELTQRHSENQMALLKEQLLATSERVLKAREEELGASNVEQMSKIVDPINAGLKLMRETLEASKREHVEAMTRLDATIDANMRRSNELGETADRLTRALLGKVKVQGNFGELKLRQLLDDLGLRENEQYSTQQTLVTRYGKSIRSDDEKRLVPDFILHFPNNRDIIVDSKVNIVDYERYINSEDELERTQHLAAHIKSIREQVKALAAKDYSRYIDAQYTKLNFVILYMFHEGALNLALLNDSALWRDAYNQGVLIMGPQTMYMNLRVLELMWTQSRQLQYQTKIVKEAETMIERVQLFARRFKDVEDSFDETLKSFEKMKLLVADRGASIITSAKHIISYGIREKSKRSISSIYVDDDSDMAIGELDENSTSAIEMNTIPEGENEALEKKYQK